MKTTFCQGIGAIRWAEDLQLKFISDSFFWQFTPACVCATLVTDPLPVVEVFSNESPVSLDRLPKTVGHGIICLRSSRRLLAR
jgi:hypothetical protein